MTRVVQSFSVPDGSIAHAKLKEWKAQGSNVSTIIQLLIEEENTQAHLDAMKKKIIRLRDITKNGARMNKQEWEHEFWMWIE